MTNWLRNRLVVWGGLSLLLGTLGWNSGALQAQTYFKTYWDAKHPRPRLSKAQASLKFAEYMRLRTNEMGTYSDYYPAPSFDETRRKEVESERLIIESVSLKSLREMGYDVRLLLDALAKQWRQEKMAGRNATAGKKAASAKAASIVAKPLVLVQENGGWGVDLVETYAKWNNLRGTAKLEAVARLTGVMLPGLPATPQSNRSYCSSNLGKLALAMAMYTQDYDERYPLARNWEKAMDVYADSRSLFRCPGLPKGKGHGYTLNRNVAGKSLAHFSGLQIVEFYETSVLKPNTVGTGENAAFRHGNGMHCTFTDGFERLVAGNSVAWSVKGKKLRFGLGK